MANTMSYGLSTWPEGSLPSPRPCRRRPVVEVGGVLRYSLSLDEADWIALPDEVFLREMMDLNLEDPQCIRAFCQEYGRLGDIKASALLGGPTDSADLQRRLTHLESEISASGVMTAADSLESDMPVEPAYQPLWLFRLHAVSFRDAVRAWLWGQNALSAQEARQQWEGNPVPEDSEEASRYLVGVLNLGLGPFSPRVNIEHGSPSHRASERESPWARYDDYGDLYGALCVQLFNHIVERPPYHVCQNESCRRVFSHHRGRREAKARSWESGVKYCSQKCTLAQGQRNTRMRRKRALQLWQEGQPLIEIARDTGSELRTLERWIAGGTKRVADQE